MCVFGQIGYCLSVTHSCVSPALLIEALWSRLHLLPRDRKSMQGDKGQGPLGSECPSLKDHTARNSMGRAASSTADQLFPQPILPLSGDFSQGQAQPSMHLQARLRIQEPVSGERGSIHIRCVPHTKPGGSNAEPHLSLSKFQRWTSSF